MNSIKDLFSFLNKEEIEGIIVEDIIDVTYQTKIVDSDPFYIKDGKGYRSCLLVYDVPDEVPLSWISSFNDDLDTYTTVDIVPIDLQQVKKSIRSAIKEFQDRIINSDDEFIIEDARIKREKMLQLISNLTGGKERILAYVVRIYLYAYTLEELEKKQKDIMRRLSERDYEASVYANEQMLEEKNKQKSYDFSLLQGGNQHEVTSLTMAGGYPFRYFDLQDKTGIYWGRNEIGANMFWDQFTNDGLYRISYNTLLVGNTGVGKSTVLSKLNRQQYLAENRVRIVDFTGEHVKSTQAMGGLVKYVNGVDVTFNPHALMMIKYKNKNDYTKDELQAILVKTVGNAKGFLQVVNKELKNEHLSIYGNIVQDLYVEKGALQRLLPITEEITFTDVKMRLREQIIAIQHDKTKRVKFEVMQELEMTIEELTTGFYANFFNAKSTYNIYEEMLVCYVMRDITTDKSILIPMFYLLLKMFMNELIYFGTPMKDLFDSGKITFEDVVKYMPVFDEAHYVLSALYPLIIKAMAEFVRESRKYFGGSVLSTHSIKEFVPDNADANSLEELKILFELMQYKFIFKHDNNAKEHLRKIFGEEIKEYHIRNVNKFQKGEAILNINGFQTQKIHVYVSEFEKQFLNGGK